jgi:hypothetical protein
LLASVRALVGSCTDETDPLISDANAPSWADVPTT